MTGKREVRAGSYGCLWLSCWQTPSLALDFWRRRLSGVAGATRARLRAFCDDFHPRCNVSSPETGGLVATRPFPHRTLGMRIAALPKQTRGGEVTLTMMPHQKMRRRNSKSVT